MTDSTTQDPGSPINDALFTEETKALPTFNVLQMTLDAAIMIPDAARGALKWKAGTSAGVTDLPGLKRRITEYIELHSIENVSVRPITLNRRFNRIASKLGSSCSTVIDQLQAAGLITSIERGGRRVWFSRRMFEFVKTNITAQGVFMDKSPTVRIAEYMDNLVDQTV